jgi:hypothetical protein
VHQAFFPLQSVNMVNTEGANLRYGSWSQLRVRNWIAQDYSLTLSQANP